MAKTDDNLLESSELLQVGALAGTALVLTALFLLQRLSYGYLRHEGLLLFLGRAAIFFLCAFAVPLGVSYGFRRRWRLAVRIASAFLLFFLVAYAMRNRQVLARDRLESAREVMDATTAMKAEMASEAKEQIQSEGYYCLERV